MGKFIVGLVIGVILVPAGFYIYLISGEAPVATWAQPMPFERTLAKTAMKATIERHEKPINLGEPSTDSLVAGAHIYRQKCAFCHGTPDHAPTAAAAGMFPAPPQFFRKNAKKIDDPAGEVYWKVQNGIRLTGMPAFRNSLTDTDMREVTGLLEDATTLPPAALSALKAAPGNVSAQGKSSMSLKVPVHPKK